MARKVVKKKVTKTAAIRAELEKPENRFADFLKDISADIDQAYRISRDRAVNNVLERVIGKIKDFT